MLQQRRKKEIGGSHGLVSRIFGVKLGWLEGGLSTPYDFTIAGLSVVNACKIMVCNVYQGFLVDVYPVTLGFGGFSLTPRG